MLYSGRYSVGFAFRGDIFGLESHVDTRTVVQDYFYGYIECGTSLRSHWLVWILLLAFPSFVESTNLVNLLETNLLPVFWT